MAVVVQQSVLTAFATAWRAFYKKETERLEKDKEFLESLKVSDLQTSLDGVKGLQAQLATEEANDIVSSIGA